MAAILSLLQFLHLEAVAVQAETDCNHLLLVQTGDRAVVECREPTLQVLEISHFVVHLKEIMVEQQVLTAVAVAAVRMRLGAMGQEPMAAQVVMELLTIFLGLQHLMLEEEEEEGGRTQEQGLAGVLVEEGWVALLTLRLMQPQVAQILVAVAVAVAEMLLVETVATAALA